MEDGSGLEGNIPPLAGADYVKNDPLATACITRKGISGEMVVNGVTYQTPMPAVTELSEFEITNVINYINHAWGNDYGVVKLEDVRAALEACQ
jgi:mono/diheme cytochrome c family protein